MGEFELSGERRQPSLDSIGSSSGLEKTSDLLQQIVDKLNELQAKFASASRSAFLSFHLELSFTPVTVAVVFQRLELQLLVFLLKNHITITIPLRGPKKLASKSVP